MGLDGPRPGSGAFHATFLSWENVVGKPRSAEQLVPSVPRKCLQSAASAVAQDRQATITDNFFMMSLVRFLVHMT
jgi:hypothetical protein